MKKVLKSKYNSTGERCVDACLSYGVLRYLNEDGSPVNIEIPCDKYEEALSDFSDRVKEGLTETEMDPNDILRRGSVTYNQARYMAMEGKIKGLDFFEIDGSIECEHVLGVSGSVEYALSIWNGESRDEALEKSVIRAIKVHGEDFIKSLTFENTTDVSQCSRFAKSVHAVDGIMGVNLYRIKSYPIDDEVYNDDLDPKQKIIKSLDIPLGIIGAFIGFIIVQIATNMGEHIKDKMVYVALNVMVMSIFAMVTMKSIKLITNKYVKNSNHSIMEMFDEELEKASYENLLTEKEYKLILKNITKGEISKLLMEMKGSVNKKVSINSIVMKETKFMIDARRSVVLPSAYEVRHTIEKLSNSYQGKLDSEYNIENT